MAETMFDLRITASELEMIMVALAGLTTSPKARDTFGTLAVQRAERTNNYGKGQH